MALAYHALGRKQDADAAIGRLKTEYAQFDAYDVAAAHAYRGEVDQAFDWLDRAYRQRDYSISWCASDPLLENLRHDPRFTALLRKMKFAF